MFTWAVASVGVCGFVPCVGVCGPRRWRSTAFCEARSRRALARSRREQEREREQVDPEAPILELQDIWLREPNTGWGYYLFEGLNFTVREHEVVLILGENGAGKSTLLDMLAGYVRPSNGQILWEGAKIKAQNLSSSVGIIFQFPANYFLGRTVLEELVLGRDYADPEMVRSIMKEVGLYDVSLLLNPRQLSGGQKRRLALASQLMRRPLPRVFLLDEPLAGVDKQGHLGIVELINKLKQEAGVVIVTHEPGVLLPCADRIVQLARKQAFPVPDEVLRKGKQLREERKDDFL